MEKAIKNILRWTNCHKWQTGICAGVAILAIGAGITEATINFNSQKLANSKALIELADENGIVTSEQIENAGDLSDLGTEIETDQGTVVLTQDENGNIVSTLIKDSEGNSTGAIVPGFANNSTSNESISSHTHNWIAHYNTRTVQTGTTYVVDVPAQPAVTQQVLVHGPGYICNTCGYYTESTWNCNHEHGGWHSCGPEYKTVVVTSATPEQGHYEPVYGQEQYVDYYYCSDCGAKQ